MTENEIKNIAKAILELCQEKRDNCDEMNRNAYWFHAGGMLVAKTIIDIIEDPEYGKYYKEAVTK